MHELNTGEAGRIETHVPMQSESRRADPNIETNRCGEIIFAVSAKERKIQN